jgi:hypothetical protein
MSLYDTALATYEASSKFDQTWSKGFIEIWAMPTVVANARERHRQSQILSSEIRAPRTARDGKLVKVNS